MRWDNPAPPLTGIRRIHLIATPPQPHSTTDYGLRAWIYGLQTADYGVGQWPPRRPPTPTLSQRRRGRISFVADCWYPAVTTPHHGLRSSGMGLRTTDCVGRRWPTQRPSTPLQPTCFPCYSNNVFDACSCGAAGIVIFLSEPTETAISDLLIWASGSAMVPNMYDVCDGHDDVDSCDVNAWLYYCVAPIPLRVTRQEPPIYQFSYPRFWHKSYARC